MKALADKMVALECDVSKEKGNFSLFVLIQREDALDKWDILVSANWIEQDKQKGMEYLVKKIHKSLDSKEILNLSRVVFLEKGNLILTAFHKAIHVEHNDLRKSYAAEVTDCVFFGFKIKHAYVITSAKTD
jgi:hypothetical protein